MLFERFRIRKTQPPALPADQEALIELVRTEQNAARRLEACHRIDRLEALRAFAETDRDAGLRELAQARYRKLLCGGEDQQEPALAERLAALARLEDPRLLEWLATQAYEPELRRQAIARLTDPEALAACALNDAMTANRRAAVERLAHRPALEQVARQIGKRDKQVYRIARRKLKEIAEREALPRRLHQEGEALCERFERLGRFENWVQDHALLALLDDQWTALEDQVEAPLRIRQARARQRFVDAYAAYCQEHQERLAAEQARQANRGTRERLIEALGICASLDEAEALVEQKEEIQRQWQALDALPEALGQPLDRAYARAARQAEARLEALRAQRAVATRLARLIESLNACLRQSHPLDQAQAGALLREAEECQGDSESAAALAATGRELCAQLEARLARQVQHARQRLAEAQEKLKELAQALEDGELKRAEPLRQSLQASLELAVHSGLPAQECQALEKALQQLAPQIREWQQWRKWGTDGHRARLCQAMEELETAASPLEAKAQRLHELQMEWKASDQDGSPVNHPLWERFHAASERVYVRCKPYLDRQAAEREAARAARAALCDQFETFLDQVDWDRVDWKAVTRAQREMRQQWAALGETEGRHRRALEKRFHRARQRLDERLAAERERNQAQKRQLIARLEALAEEPDLEQAIAACKRLQHDWHTTVPARQKEENRLWQQFRDACEAVFARRREQFEALAAEQEEHRKTREEICAAGEALVAAATEAEALEAAWPALEERWRATAGLPLPRGAAGPLERRWRQVLEHREHRRRGLQAKRRQATLDLLARQAAVCAELERAAEAGQVAGARIEAAEAAWEALPGQVDKRLQGGILARFKAARQAASGEKTTAWRDALPENARRRAELCLQLEILGHIESPPEHLQERLAFQVNRLKEHMRSGEKDPLAEAPRLLERWYLYGPAAAADTPALEARFERAREALEQADRDAGAAPLDEPAPVSASVPAAPHPS